MNQFDKQKIMKTKASAESVDGEIAWKLDESTWISRQIQYQSPTPLLILTGNIIDINSIH